MSDVSEKDQFEIDLCYKALGLSLSDNPEQVEKAYRKLKDEYGKAMRSPDPAGRATAAENMKQLEELYTTITGSMIYKDYAREHEKYKAQKAEEMAARKQKPQQLAVKDALVNCPYCGKMISPKLKVCMYCRGKILTPMEQMMEKLFSPKVLIIVTIIVVLVIAGVILISNPQLLK